MAIDLTELYKQRQAIDAEIKTLREQAVREGEVIVIDGVTIDSTIDVDGEMQNPVETDYFFTYRKDDNGDIIDQGEITYKDLIDRFGQGISGKEDEAIQAIEDATEENKTELDTYAEGIKTESLDPLVERAETAATNAEASEQGAETAYNNTVAAKDEAVEAINTEEQSALSAIDSAKESALDSIGESDTEGARGNAIESINSSKESALDSIDAQKESALTELNGKMHVGYREMIGDGSSTTFIITHNLGCQWVLCQVWFTDLGAKYYHSIHELDNNRIQIDFNYPPPASSVDVRIVPNIRLEEGGGSLPDDFLITQEHIDDSVECTQSDVADLIAILG